MNKNASIVDVGAGNMSEHPEAICFINQKNPCHGIKTGWLGKRFKEGLKIKLLYLGGDKKPAGLIEYVPGEYAWRAVSAKDYMFIHCIWVYPNKNKDMGLGSMLIEECVKDAKKQGFLGVAVIASEGPFMAKKEIFQKNGFSIVESCGKYSLLTKSFKKGSLPKFRDWEKQLAGYKGLNIVYSNQCPWVARFVTEVSESVREKGLRIKFNELKTAKDAQDAPSIYAVFSLIKDGKLLADHYISETRFRNILKKEIA